MIKYPKSISFEMVASSGSWKGTFAVTAEQKQVAKIDAKLIDPIRGIYRVIMKAPKPYVGPYEYKMPYDILTKWQSHSDSGSWYNSNIRGSYRP
jgi:hypothetical protein